jgi:hypothetical protein
MHNPSGQHVGPKMRVWRARAEAEGAGLSDIVSQHAAAEAVETESSARERRDRWPVYPAFISGQTISISGGLTMHG